MAQEMRLKIAGLYTHPSDLSEVPEGALLQAKNIVIDEESIAEPRRGFDQYDYVIEATGSVRGEKIFSYEDKIIVHKSDDTLAYDSGSAFTDYSGTIAPPDSSTKMRAAQASGNFYFTTSKGVYKLDSSTGTPVAAGADKGLTIELAVGGSGQAVADTETVAYRVVWGYEDANSNLILGAPSERRELTNSAGSDQEVDVTITIPANATTSWLYQVYRTDSTSGSPGDEMQLVYEANPTSAQITSGTITIADNTPDNIKGATLYTSPSQETIANQNTEPPFAKDIALFKNRIWFANTKSRHSLQITLIASDSSGPQNNDTIQIDGTTYTWKTSPSASTDIQITTSGTPAQDIADMAQELCKVVNQYSSNTTINAFYVSGVDNTPGIILLEKRDVSASSFTVTASEDSYWQPAGLDSATTSTNDQFANGLMFSKNQEPEAVPAKNLFRIGSQSDEIRRILPLRDSLFVLTDGGVYRVTGEDEGSFRVDLFDNTVKIIGAETARTLNNAIYFLSDQGVVQLTETGASVISRPIESDLLEIVGTILSTVESYGFAVGYESERKYILGVPTTSTDTAATRYYVYNTFTRAWTTWEDVDALTGAVDPATDKLFFSDDSTNYLLQERKTYDFSDYVDYSKTITISSVSADGLTLTLNASDASGVSEGDVIYQANDAFSVVSNVDTDNDQLTLEFDGGLSAASATVLAGIESIVEWVPFAGQNPGMLKQFNDIGLIFRENFRVEADVGFTSDQSQSVETVTFSGQSFGHFGFFEWGDIPWGGEIGKEPVRTWPPLEKGRATQLNVRFTHKIGYSGFKLNGVSVHYNEISERFRR